MKQIIQDLITTEIGAKSLLYFISKHITVTLNAYSTRNLNISILALIIIYFVMNFNL